MVYFCMTCNLPDNLFHRAIVPTIYFQLFFKDNFCSKEKTIHKSIAKVYSSTKKKGAKNNLKKTMLRLDTLYYVHLFTQVLLDRYAPLA